VKTHDGWLVCDESLLNRVALDDSQCIFYLSITTIKIGKDKLLTFIYLCNTKVSSCKAQCPIQLKARYTWLPVLQNTISMFLGSNQPLCN